jgi:hypothetical protein
MSAFAEEDLTSRRAHAEGRCGDNCKSGYVGIITTRVIADIEIAAQRDSEPSSADR